MLDVVVVELSVVSGLAFERRLSDRLEALRQHQLGAFSRPDGEFDFCLVAPFDLAFGRRTAVEMNEPSPHVRIEIERWMPFPLMLTPSFRAPFARSRFASMSPLLKLCFATRSSYSFWCSSFTFGALLRIRGCACRSPSWSRTPRREATGAEAVCPSEAGKDSSRSPRIRPVEIVCLSLFSSPGPSRASSCERDGERGRGDRAQIPGPPGRPPTSASRGVRLVTGRELRTQLVRLPIRNRACPALAADDRLLLLFRPVCGCLPVVRGHRGERESAWEAECRGERHHERNCPRPDLSRLPSRSALPRIRTPRFAAVSDCYWECGGSAPVAPAPYSGMLPCLRFGPGSRLLCSV